MKLTLDKMGRIVIPKALRDRFALHPGDELDIVVEPDGFRVRPADAQPALEWKEGILVCRSEIPPALWDLSAFLDEEREQRSRQLGGM